MIAKTSDTGPKEMTAANPAPGEPATLDTLVALAQREHGAGRLAEAEAAYRKILALRPDIAEVCANLGLLLANQAKLDEAAVQFERAVALKPDLFQAHLTLGELLQAQGKLDQAAARFEQLLALCPELAEAHYSLGGVLVRQGKLEEAAARFERAAALRPDLAEAHNNLGNILREQGRHDEAVARYQQALALWPEYAEAHYNLGFTLREQGKLEPAAAHYQHALALRPDYPDAQLGLAACYLAEGDYERGWPLYEGRLRVPGFVTPHDLPRWAGQPLTGRSLLLLAEQGLGDTLHFIRYARTLKEQGARIVLACQPALGRLLESHPDVDELFLLGSAAELPRCDFCLPLLSAPGTFGTDASTIPCDVPYVTADPELRAKWRAELAGIDGFKIGIVWQGSRDYPSDRLRSIPLCHFAPLARLPGVRLISLQKGFGSEQISTVDFPVLDLSDRLDHVAGPFMDAAAVIGSVDLVVTPDTAIGHLAGALGAPVWLALQFSPNWRWLRKRDDSPWYPTMRLFRQTAFGQWPDVFERMADALQAGRETKR
jgi:tetratricopeptide (TPR) repeat protein